MNIIPKDFKLKMFGKDRTNIVIAIYLMIFISLAISFIIMGIVSLLGINENNHKVFLSPEIANFKLCGFETIKGIKYCVIDGIPQYEVK